MKKKYKIIHLPTSDASHLFIKNGVIGYWGKPNATIDHNPQHLYILSDEAPKTEGYYYSVYLNRIIKLNKNDNEITGDAKEIIATTDKSLTKNISRLLGVTQELPQIPTQLIKAYAEQQMEYLMLESELISGDRGYSEKEISVVLDVDNIDIAYKLKLTDNNEVVWSEYNEFNLIEASGEVRDFQLPYKIGGEEKMYSREEVKKLLIQYQFDRGISPIGGKEFDDWIKENLK